MKTINALAKVIGYAILLACISPLVPVFGLMWLFAALENEDTHVRTETGNAPAPEKRPTREKQPSSTTSIFGLSSCESVHLA